MEDDVVLAHEVRVQGLRLLPPVAPRLRSAAIPRPLDGRREVADDGVEPDVDPLRLLRVALDGNRDAPVDVPRHGARLQIVDERQREVAHVRAPVRLPFDPRPKTVGELGQVEEEVRGLAELGGRPVDDRVRIDQIGRVELVPAVVALVPASLRVAADRARPFDVPVGQRVAGRGGERPERRLLDEMAVLVQRTKDVARDVRVVAGRRTREAVVADAEVAQVIAGQLVVTLRDLTRRDAFPVGRVHHRRPMLVGAAHHQDVVALQAVVAREDVGGNREPDDVAQVTPPRRIRPGGGDQDLALLRVLRQTTAPARPGT